MGEIILYWTLQVVVGMFVASLLIISGMLFWLVYKICRVPNDIWEEGRKKPTRENLKRVVEHILK